MNFFVEMLANRALMDFSYINTGLDTMPIEVNGGALLHFTGH